MSVRKKYLTIAIIFLIVGLGLGTTIGQSDPPTPTLDAEIGIYDFPWVNSTIGTNNPTYYLNDEDKTDIFEYPEQCTSYIVFKDGSTYYAKNASTGQIDSSDSDFETLMEGIIQDDIEIYLKKGEYTSSGSIDIQSSNMKIKGSGNSTLIVHQYHGNPAFNIYSTDNSNPVENVVISDIGFIGYSDAENHMIGFKNCTNFLVERCYFENVGDESIWIGKNSRLGIIRNNWFLSSPYNDTAGSAINLQGSSYIIIKDNYINMTGGVEGLGIHLEAILTVGDISNIDVVGNTVINCNTGVRITTLTYDVYDVKIIGNTIINATLGGIMDSASGAEQCYRIIVDSNIVKDGGTDASARGAINFIKNNPEFITISNNQVYNWGTSSGDKHGINVAANNTIISNNLINGTGDVGIRVTRSHVIITGNIIKNHGQGGGIKAGIQVYQDYCTIIGNTIENGNRGIRLESTSSNTIVTGNTLYDNSIPIDDQIGTSNKIYCNIGYVTENIGESTILNGLTSVVVSHGCDYTPSAGDISVIPIESLGSASYWYIGTISSTQFTINVNADPQVDVDFAWNIKRH